MRFGIFKSKKSTIAFAAVAIILALALSFGIWYGSQEKFRDVTVELGEDVPQLSVFKTEYAIDFMCGFETDTAELDISKPGEYKLTLHHGFKKETVTMSVVDTTAPTVVFRDVTVYFETEIHADDFVSSVFDLSATSIDFGSQLPEEHAFGTYPVDIVVSDIYGNRTTETCNLHYVWILPEYILEIGQKLEMDDLLTCSDRDETILSQEWIDTINQSPVGTYTFESKYGEYSRVCTVKIQDTLAPELEVEDITTYLGRSVSVEDFIKNISDGSGAYELTTSPIPSTDTVGTHTITFKVVDGSGNETEKSVLLHIIADTEPPVFGGVGTLHIEIGDDISFRNGVRATDNQDGAVDFTVDTSGVNLDAIGTYYVTYYASDRAGNKSSAKRTIVVDPDSTAPVFSGLSDMTVEKNSAPDYAAGVNAHDSYDGDVAFSYNTDNVDLSKAGTYFIVYTAEDKTGNVATARRKIVVNIDSTDIAALVAQEAATLSSDPEAIRDHIRNSIGYSSNWGGEYPVWHGFTTKTGNCYVHALCFQAILEAKGFETMIIWCENKSHYWNLVKINGEWKHMDSTPIFAIHQRYSIMSDEQRYETLDGRDWDRTAWPVCN